MKSQAFYKEWQRFHLQEMNLLIEKTLKDLLQSDFVQEQLNRKVDELIQSRQRQAQVDDTLVYKVISRDCFRRVTWIKAGHEQDMSQKAKKPNDKLSNKYEERI